MKTNLTFRAFMIFAVLASASSSMADQNKFEIMRPKTIFTPKSFDSNDNAQVVLAGVFTGFCMKVGSVRQRVDKTMKRIYIDQYVSMTPNCKDLEMYIPYSSVVDLGALAPGNYEVYSLDSESKYMKMEILPVQAARKSPGANGTDERLYAPVSSLQFAMANNANTAIINIKGVLTNTCLELGAIEAHPRSGNVIEVLPVLKRSGATHCTASMTPFSKNVTLNNFPSGDTLIHVRSMNGLSVNKVITNLDRIVR